jgi:hypothetical protein
MRGRGKAHVHRHLCLTCRCVLAALAGAFFLLKGSNRVDSRAGCTGCAVADTCALIVCGSSWHLVQHLDSATGSPVIIRAIAVWRLMTDTFNPSLLTVLIMFEILADSSSD